MDEDLLRQWLHLPPGPWPPTHYVLLRLEPGNLDMARVEQHVMARMEILRHHQLRHPEAVTTGMNRLAEALNCLTNPAERASYDASLNARPSVRLRTAPRSETTPVEEWSAKESVRVPAPPTCDPQVQPVVMAHVVAEPPSRRGLYHRLAVLRRMTRAWDALAPVVANPEETLDQPLTAFTFLDAVLTVRSLRKELRSVLPPASGGLVQAIVEMSPILETVRALLPEQRRRLAVDWRRAWIELEAESVRLRRQLRRSSRSRSRCRSATLAGVVKRFPEFFLLALLVAALAFAWRRPPTSP